MGKTVEEYIESQKSPQKEILRRLREIFLKTLETPEENVGWGVVIFGRGKFYIVALKDRVHVGFAITGLDKDEIRLFEGSGKTMKHIKVYSVDDIDEEKIVGPIKMVDKKAVFTENIGNRF